jgi:hypothetical protein
MSKEAEQESKPSKSRRRLDALIQEKGLKPGTYGIFDNTGEGKFFPGDSPEDRKESESGHIVTSDGRHFFYWTDWDKKTRREKFSIFKEYTPSEVWEDTEYKKAVEEANKNLQKPQ